MARGKFERAPEPSRRARPRVKAEPAGKRVQAEKKEPVEKKKRNPILVVLNVLKTLLVWLVMLTAVGMMIFTVVSVTTLDRSERSILGYKAFIVLSDSMKATDFDAGDVVLVKPVDPATLQPGDIIAFTSQLAHIVSSAYVKSPEAQRRRGFSAGSFQDMTRVARLDENMWTELFLDDADYLTTELDEIIRHLTEYQDALKARDAQKLHDLLKDGREKKASAGGH